MQHSATRSSAPRLLRDYQSNPPAVGRDGDIDAQSNPAVVAHAVMLGDPFVTQVSSSAPTRGEEQIGVCDEN